MPTQALEISFFCCDLSLIEGEIFYANHLEFDFANEPGKRGSTGDFLTIPRTKIAFQPQIVDEFDADGPIDQSFENNFRSSP